MRRVLLASVVCFLMAAPAMAELSLQQVLDGITTNPYHNSSVDALPGMLGDDSIAEGSDDYWAVGGSGGSVATMIIEIAGNASSNTFGVYDALDFGNKVELFDGSATTGDQVTLSIYANGDVYITTDSGKSKKGTFDSNNVFGFYLGVGNGRLLQ